MCILYYYLISAIIKFHNISKRIFVIIVDVRQKGLLNEPEGIEWILLKETVV